MRFLRWLSNSSQFVFCWAIPRSNQARIPWDSWGSWMLPFQTPQCHLWRSVCWKSIFPTNLKSNWKKYFWKVTNDLHWWHLLSTHPCKHAAPEKPFWRIPQGGGKPWFFFPIIWTTQGRPNDNSVRTPDKTVLCVPFTKHKWQHLCLFAGTHQTMLICGIM